MRLAVIRKDERKSREFQIAEALTSIELEHRRNGVYTCHVSEATDCVDEDRVPYLSVDDILSANEPKYVVVNAKVPWFRRLLRFVQRWL